MTENERVAIYVIIGLRINEVCSIECSIVCSTTKRFTMSEKSVDSNQVSTTNVDVDASQLSVPDDVKRITREPQQPKPIQFDLKQSSTSATSSGYRSTNDHDLSSLSNGSSFEQSINSHRPSSGPIGSQYASFDQLISARDIFNHQQDSTAILSTTGDATPHIDNISQFPTSESTNVQPRKLPTFANYGFRINTTMKMMIIFVHNMSFR